LLFRNYWRDHDTALFILKHLYRDIPEEGGPSKDNGVSTGLPGIPEEELPLTFSSNSLIGKFSQETKKNINRSR